MPIAKDKKINTILLKSDVLPIQKQLDQLKQHILQRLIVLE